MAETEPLLEEESLRLHAYGDPAKQAEQLRKEYEAGDPMAANVAYLLCKEAAWPWLEQALQTKLESELEQSKRRRQTTETWYGKLIRYQTFNWLRLKGYSQDDARGLAGVILDTSPESIQSAVNFIKRELELPKGKVIPAEGLEKMEPCDLPHGPDELKSYLLREAFDFLRNYKIDRERHLTLAAQGAVKFLKGMRERNVPPTRTAFENILKNLQRQKAQ